MVIDRLPINAEIINNRQSLSSQRVTPLLGSDSRR